MLASADKVAPATSETFERDLGNGDREWSIQSAATDPPKLAGRKFYRLFVFASRGDCLLSIDDVRVTSGNPEARRLKGQDRQHVNITTTEAEWLVETLQKAIAHMRSSP